MPRRKPEDYQ
jgi:hypothetical protein